MSDTQIKRSGFIGATIGNAWGGLRDAVSGVKPTRSKMMEYDQPLLWVAIVLLGLGLVMVYSASIALPDSPIPDGRHQGGSWSPSPRHSAARRLPQPGGKQGARHPRRSTEPARQRAW